MVARPRRRYEAYVQEVRAKSFPAAAHARRMDPGEARALYEHLGMDLAAEQRPSAVESALPQEALDGGADEEE